MKVPAVNGVYRALIPVRVWFRSVLARALWTLEGWFRYPLPSQCQAHRDLLFVVKNPLGLDYVRFHWKLLRDNPNYHGHLFVPGHLRKQLKEGEDLEPVGLLRALFTRWDLVAFPSHFLGAFFHPDLTKLYLSHGLQAGGKIVGDTGYAYSWKALLTGNRAFYTRFMANNRTEAAVASSAHPMAFSDKILVTGDPVAIALDPQPRSLAGERTRRIVVASSWGHHSLLEKHGLKLRTWYDQLTARGYSVRFSFHPHAYGESGHSNIIDGLARAGAEIIPPGPRHWTAQLGCTDLVVSDKTSLSLYFALFGVPVLYVPLKDEEFVPGSALLELYRRSPVLDPDCPLSPQLEGALGMGQSEQARRYMKETFPYARDRTHYLKHMDELVQG